MMNYIKIVILSILVIYTASTAFANDIDNLSISFHGVTTSPSPEDISYHTEYTNETIFVSKTPVISDEHIDSIKSTDKFINVKFTKAGDKLFFDFTKANLGKRMAVMINGDVVIAPVIRSPIIGGGASLPASVLEKKKEK